MPFLIVVDVILVHFFIVVIIVILSSFVYGFECTSIISTPPPPADHSPTYSPFLFVVVLIVLWPAHNGKLFPSYYHGFVLCCHVLSCVFLSCVVCCCLLFAQPDSVFSCSLSLSLLCFCFCFCCK